MYDLHFYIGDRFPLIKNIIKSNNNILFLFNIEKYYEDNNDPYRIDEICYYDERRKQELTVKRKSKSNRNMYLVNVIELNKSDVNLENFTYKIDDELCISLYDVEFGGVCKFILKIKKPVFKRNFMEFDKENCKKYTRLMKLKQLKVEI